MPTETRPPAIVTRALRKEYKEVVAVKSLDLEIAGGEVFGLLGPNGAGKTTTISMLCTVLRPSGGVVLPDGGQGLTVDDATKQRAVARFLRG